MNQTKPTLIFDMDGVILDTEQLVRRCWNEIAPEFHADAIDAVFLTTVGTTRVHTCSILRERYGADFPAEEFNNAVSRRYHVIDDAEGVPVKTGARELLQWARDNAYTIGLASSTRQAVVEKELSERGLLPYFDYVLGGDRAYGYNYGDTFDGAQLKYGNDKFAVTAGYGKFKEGDIAGVDYSAFLKGTGIAVPDGIEGTKTGYGELEGFFGGGRVAGSAVGVYYNDFSANEATRESLADDLWGAYVSANFGKWNALANYERVSYEKNIATANGQDDSANVWIGKLTYGKAGFATPKSWDAWVEYINAEDGAFVGGSTNGWRWGDHMDNIESWGVGADYTFAKNAMFQVMQSFGTNTKDGNAKDPEEQTRAQFVFAF